ncbi:hypothetical protein [Metapseudomonas otitidis]|uniref:hypothetical protein n=1 Tax=Metapseudomonas otitidis TaxID=319939 RepID=UPI0013F60EF9|nr:hypothetical protein [Pseudomonas otitidis]
MPRDKIDVQWLFAARSGDVSKIIDYLMESGSKDPERVLAILKAAKYPPAAELETLIKSGNKMGVVDYMDDHLLPVLEKIFKSGGKLTDVAG